MTTPYKNHVFQRSTFPWMVLTNLGLALAIVAGIASFWIAKNWVDQGRYLQSIETEQIEALRLAPLLKDLKTQVGGPFALDPSFFAALKKADKALKLTADDLPSPSAVNNVAGIAISATALSKGDKVAEKTAKADKPVKVDADKEAVASLKPVLGSKLKGPNGLNKEGVKVSESSADKSSNPIVKFFKKVDNKVSQIFFGKKEELVGEDGVETSDKKEAGSGVPEVAPVQVSAQDFLANAKLVDKAVGNVLFQERSLAGLAILAKSADTLLAPKAAFELDKLAEDAPGRKFAESLVQFNKANSAWQKNITDNAASEELLKVMGELIDQKVLLEIAAGKKSANKPEAKFTEAMTKLHQSAWHTKLPQETVIALKQFSSGIQTIRELASAPESYADLLQKNGSLLKVSDPSIKSGFLFYMLLSIGGSVLALLSSMMLIRAYRLNAADLILAQRRKPDATDKLLSSIDLGFAAPEMAKPTRLEPAPMAQNIPTPAAPIAPAEQFKANAAHLSGEDSEQLQAEFLKKIATIEANFRVLGQMGLKLRQSIIGVHSKASELHHDRLESNSARAKASASAAAASGKDNAGPVDQLLEAFFAVKQQGVRLYLSILDNHSSRQLAMETEQLNSLVERVETTVLQIRGTLTTMLDGAQKVSNAQEANQITNSQFAAIEMMELDANQALRDLEQWQSEFDKLGNSLTAAQR